jgi:hypothetical protein
LDRLGSHKVGAISTEARTIDAVSYRISGLL